MTDKKRGDRWYDKHPELADHLDTLKAAEHPRRKSIIDGLLSLLKYDAPQAVAEAEKKEPPAQSRRWYDHDPQMWRVMSGLQGADFFTIGRAIGYLHENLNDGKEKK